MIRGAGDASAPPAEPAPSTADYLLTGTVRPAPDRIRVSARVVVGATGAQLLGARRTTSPPTSRRCCRSSSIAERVSMAIAEPFGPIFREEGARGRPQAGRVSRYLRLRAQVPLLSAQHRPARPWPKPRVLPARRRPRAATHGRRASALVYLRRALVRLRRARRRADDAHARSRPREPLSTSTAAARSPTLAMARVCFALGDVAGFERAAERVESASRSIPTT